MRQATKKDYDPIRERTMRFKDAVENDIKGADLKDHGGTSMIRMGWGMNKEMERDHIFLLEINGEKAFIDLEELMSYTRLM